MQQQIQKTKNLVLYNNNSNNKKHQAVILNKI
jgi:hypothetical protein